MKSFYPPGTEKAISQAAWGVAGTTSGNVGGAGQLSVRGAEASSRSLSPLQSYELSVAVNACVRVIADNIAKAKRRIFTPDGEEVTGGPAWDYVNRPNPFHDGHQFIRDLATWYLINGEFAAWNRPEGGRLSGYILSPHNLSVWPQNRYATRADIAMWRYTWHNGQQDDIPDSQLLFGGTFNPSDPVRGLSPLVTGAVEVGIGHWGIRYNQSVFQNGAVPSGAVVLPEGTSKKEREDFTRRFLEEFAYWNHNAHKVMVISGGDVKWLPFQTNARDGDFLNLLKETKLAICQLYRVPPSEVQLGNESRSEWLVAEERMKFMENTLEPLAEMLSSAFQHQVFDRFFTGSSFTRSKAKMSKALSARFETARAEAGGRLIYLIDTDTLPIAQKVKVAQAERAKMMRHAFALSPQEVCDQFNIEVEEREERRDIYLESTDRNITRPERNIEVMSASMKAKQPAEDKPKASVADAKKSIHKLRTLTLKALGGDLWRLDDVAEVAPVRLAAEVRLGVKAAFKAGDRDGVKAYFDSLDPRRFAEE